MYNEIESIIWEDIYNEVAKRNMIKYTYTVNKVSADDIAHKDVTTFENSELFNYNLKSISQESSSQSHLPDVCELSAKP